jgi:hypothetical protein
MDLITSKGEMKVFPADISVIKSTGTPFGRICCKVTSSVAISRTATEMNWVAFNTAVSDIWGCFRPTISTFRVYCPQTGWYYCNAYISSTTATAHEAELQIHHTYLGSFFAYNKKKFTAGSATYPNTISASGLTYLRTGDYFYVNWGTTQAITSLTGEANVGFGIWKVNR